MGETRLAIKPIRMEIKDLSRSFSEFYGLIAGLVIR
jgi:hypothetical protein